MQKGSILTVVSVFSWFATLGNVATAQSLQGREAFGDWERDKPGTIRLIRPQDLPKPGATPSAGNFSHIVPRPSGAAPQVPPGFKINLFAEGLSAPRIIRVAPNGDIFVAETRAGRVRVLRAADGAAKADTNEILPAGFTARSELRSSRKATTRNSCMSPTPTV